MYKSVYGGNLYVYKRVDRNNRPEHSWRVCGKECEKLIDDLSEHSILKLPQLLAAKPFFKLIKKHNCLKEKEKIMIQLEQLKKEPLKDIDVNKLTTKYVAGLFDAEGCLTLFNGSLRAKITQKSHPILLYKLQEKYGGTVELNNFCWNLYGLNTRYFLESVLPFLFIKKEQVIIGLEYLEHVKNKTHTTEIANKLETLIKEQKHIETL